jgi:hypothetical protein
MYGGKTWVGDSVSQLSFYPSDYLEVNNHLGSLFTSIFLTLTTTMHATFHDTIISLETADKERPRLKTQS